jgi:hypothetical protein
MKNLIKAIEEIKKAIEKLEKCGRLKDNYKFTIEKWNNKMANLGLPDDWKLINDAIVQDQMANDEMFIKLGKLQSLLLGIAFFAIGWDGNNLHLESHYGYNLDDIWEAVKDIKEL